jgi:hypothetical protein
MFVNELREDISVLVRFTPLPQWWQYLADIFTQTVPKLRPCKSSPSCWYLQPSHQILQLKQLFNEDLMNGVRFDILSYARDQWFPTYKLRICEIWTQISRQNHFVDLCRALGQVEGISPAFNTEEWQLVVTPSFIEDDEQFGRFYLKGRVY